MDRSLEVFCNCQDPTSKGEFEQISTSWRAQHNSLHDKIAGSDILRAHIYKSLAFRTSYDLTSLSIDRTFLQN